MYFNVPIAQEFLPIASWNFGMFGRIIPDCVSDDSRHVDDTIVAMVKALIAPRLTPDDSGFCYYFRKYGNSSMARAEEFDSLEGFAKYEYLIDCSYGIPTLTIVSTSGELFNILSRKSKPAYPELEQFFTQQNLPIILLPWEANNKGKHLIVFINRQQSNYGKAWHAVASLIPKILPQYFEDVPITDDETKVLMALGSGDPSEFVNVFKKYLEDKHYFDDYITEELSKFASNKYTRQIDVVKRSLRNRKEDVESYIQTISTLYGDIDRLEIQLIGLESKKNSVAVDAELLDYIKNNKSISVVKIHDGLLTYDVRTYLMNFDADLYNDISNNLDANMYACAPCDVPKEDIRLLYDSIFRNFTVKLRMSARVTIGFDNRGNIYYDGQSSLFEETRLRNPHLYHHNCFGNNKLTIIDCLNNGDFVGAIATTISSTGNLNFGDPYVSSEFASELFDSSIRCIEFPDGECLNAYDAIERIKNEQTNNANQ